MRSRYLVIALGFGVFVHRAYKSLFDLRLQGGRRRGGLFYGRGLFDRRGVERHALAHAAVGVKFAAVRNLVMDFFVLVVVANHIFNSCFDSSILRKKNSKLLYDRLLVCRG